MRRWALISGVSGGLWAQSMVGTVFPTPLSQACKHRALGWSSCIQLDSFRQEGRGATESTGTHSLTCMNASSSPGHAEPCGGGSPGSGMQQSSQGRHCSLERTVLCAFRVPTLWVSGDWAPNQLRSAFPDTDAEKSGFKGPAPFKIKSGLSLSLNILATYFGIPRWLSSQESTCNAGVTGDVGSIPGLGRSSVGGDGHPLQHSYLGNPMDRGAYRWAIVPRVAKSQTQLNLSMHTQIRLRWNREISGKTMSWSSQTRVRRPAVS